ncbi:MAG TPA: AMP-binding protein, partial [Candidatus Deferrimicrobium sp.]|nr:AMP-binding protein [Candidatus Deferrimicrobium sp.]
MIFNSSATILKGFQDQVQMNPTSVALSFESTVITYCELNEKVVQIAGQLVELGIKPGDTAAVNFHTPLEMAAGLLAIIRAGGIYLPLPQQDFYPASYISRVLAASGTRYLISPGLVEKIGETLGKAKETEVLMTIYESWSPGLRPPEGIDLTHDYIAQWLSFNIETLKIDCSRSLFIASPRLEPGFPFWLANLATGGEVHFADSADIPDFTKICVDIRAREFKSLICPLFFLQKTIVQNGFREIFTNHLSNIVNIVSMGEEVFDSHEFKNFLKEKKIRWHNYFGFPGLGFISTLSNEHEQAGKKDEFRHVGKLAPWSKAYILDNERKLAPMGMTGELYSSGKGTRFHCGGEENTNLYHFKEDSLGIDEFIYKTAYDASWLEDWKISIAGKTNGLFNINGTRVAGESVEMILRAHPLVKDCVVLAGQSSAGLSRLIAYIVLNEDKDGTVDMFAEFTAAQLPACLLP